MVVRVSPGAKNPTHDISLSDGVQTWGLRLDGGPEAIQETPQTASARIPNSFAKFGDWEPGYAQLEQRTWTGGRGSNDFSLDRTRFHDSMMAYTLIDGAAFPAPQWKFATGLCTSHEYLPGDVDWQALLGDNQYIAAQFTVGASSFDAQTIRLWLRRVGSPADLTVEIWTDDGSDKPNALVASATDSVATNIITDVISLFHGFDVSAAASLSASTKYHVVVYAASADNAANHWELGVDAGAAASTQSADGSAWNAATFSLYFRVEDADTNRKFHFFEMKGALYAVDENADGSTSNLYMNGERGRATSGSSNTLTDTDEGISAGWAADQWNGWYIKLTAGTGAGQSRLITAMTSAGVITVDQDWDINPDGASDYVIYAGAAWQPITISGDAISDVVKDVVVFNGFATLAQGENTLALFVRYNGGSSPPAHQGDNAPNVNLAKVDLLHVSHKPGRGPMLWLVRNADMTITRMKTFSWAAPAASDISDSIKVGSKTWEMINLTDLDGKIFVFKQDGLYSISNDRANKMNIGLDLIKSYNNGQAMSAHNSSLYFSWADFSLQRLVGRDVNSVGPNRGVGLPDGRGGAIVALASHPEGLFACLDAGVDGTSSLLIYTDERLGWHEIFRAWDTGVRVQNLTWQVNPGTRPRLWISAGGEMIYQEWPRRTSNPLEDSGMNYQHEAVLVSADMDMGLARLPKFIKELTLITEKLTTGIEIQLDYQLDADIGGAEWTSAGTFYTSPEDTLPLQRGDVRKIRLRLRLLTNNAGIPPVMRAAILEAFARTPLKYRWNVRVRIADNQLTLVGGKDHDPDAFTTWLKDAARQAKRIHMRAVWEQMDDKFVIVEPPKLRRTFTNRILGWWGGTQEVSIREA
ncbi:MAG: hypothetical protein IH859_01660 [Chloroflexi bacterium]|nr:hypothetical protein [Chloroflexota bacterium]